MLRAAVAAKSPMGLEAKKAMDAGALVSDDIVVGLIEEAMQSPACRTGALSRVDAFRFDAIPAFSRPPRMLAVPVKVIQTGVCIDLPERTCLRRVSISILWLQRMEYLMY